MFLSGMLARGRTRVKNGPASGIGRLVWWLPALLWMSGIVYLSQQTTPPGAGTGVLNAVTAHLILYGVLALALHAALVGSAGLRAGVPLWAPALVSFALAVLFGIADELHHAFVPGRVASEADLAVDAAGAAIGVGIGVVATMFVRYRHAFARSSGRPL